jgi:hypothetical protein
MAATSHPINQTEHEVLDLLCSANTSTTWDGHIRWHLDGDDVAVLLELGAELAGGALDPAESNRVARLLGASGR